VYCTALMLINRVGTLPTLLMLTSGSDSQSFPQVFHHLTAEQVNTTGLLDYLVLLKHHKHNINENSYKQVIW